MVRWAILDLDDGRKMLVLTEWKGRRMRTMRAIGVYEDLQSTAKWIENASKRMQDDKEMYTEVAERCAIEKIRVMVRDALVGFASDAGDVSRVYRLVRQAVREAVFEADELLDKPF